MKLHIRRPMIPLFLLTFVASLVFRPLILRPYEKEREPFLILYNNKEEECVVIGTVKDVVKGEEKTILILTDCTIAGYTEYEARKCGGVRLYADNETDYKCGNVVRAYGGIKIFMEAQNPGQFDYYEYYRRQHLYANVYAQKVNLLSGEVSGFRQGLTSLKLRFMEVYRELYPKDEGGVVYALVTGDKSLLSPDTKEDFTRAGISHILAVSGLHISFICLGFNKLLKYMTIRKRIRDGLTVAFTLLFVLFTGAGISVIRAGIMCFCMLLAENVERRYDMLSALSFAGFIELIIYPLEGLTASFLLSYMAIVGVHAAAKIRAGIFSGLIITLFTLPVTLYFYYEFSSYGILAGILVIPVTGIALGLGLLSGMMGMINLSLGILPAGTVYLIIRWMERISGMVQKLPFSTVTLGKPTLPGIVIYYICLCLGVRAISRFKEEGEDIKVKGRLERIAKREGLKRLCQVLLALSLPAILAISFHVPQNGMTFLSVGQGDGIVFHNRETIVFDCGSSSESMVGKYILSPFLKRMGVNIIDLAVVSHMDSDHTSGILEILEKMPIYKGQISFWADYNGDIAIRRLALPQISDWSEDYEKMVRLAESKGVEVIFLEQGDEITTKNATMLCLWPYEARESANETSVVMLLATKRTAYLLTGDATTESEEKIVAVYTEGLRALVQNLGYNPTMYILKVGHHGSKTSTSEALLKWGDFNRAVISVGHFNTYGHPKQEILDRLEDAGILVHRTDLEGAVRK